METDKALEKASILIDGIFDSHFRGPKELSEMYTKKQYPEDLSRLGLMKSEYYRRAYNNKKNSKGRNCPDYLIKSMTRTIYEHENRRKEMIIRLSDKTRSAVKGYKRVLINRLMDALIDFEEAVVLSKTVNTMFKTIAQIQRRCKLAVQGADLLLKNGYLNAEHRNLTQELRDFHEKMLPKEEEIFLDTDQIVMLIKTYSVNTRGLKYAFENWENAWFRSVLRYQYSMEIGRPKDVIFKAIQIVIFNILQGKAQVKKELAADIIKEAYHRLNIKPLTSKDIDNALHSST